MLLLPRGRRPRVLVAAFHPPDVLRDHHEDLSVLALYLLPARPLYSFLRLCVFACCYQLFGVEVVEGALHFAHGNPVLAAQRELEEPKLHLARHVQDEAHYLAQVNA
ncbi:unnamed protein product, partial [Ixodes hexagonus]